jgi:23S rRNA (adenine2503-C2)-methyltransferase
MLPVSNGMEYSKIIELMKDEPRYRLDQVKQAVFVDLLDNWDDVTWLPKKTREELQRECPLDITAEMSTSVEDDANKVLITLSDGNAVEAVLMRHKGGRNTVCVSTQVGCPMRCTFCATGKMGLTRNLSSDEMIEQVVYFSRLLKKEEARVGSIVYMGMGEPFLNYDNVLESIRVMHDPKGLNIGARHFSISTCGIIEGIKKLSDENMDVNMAISLHAPNNEVRKRLMPIAQAHSLELLFETVDAYIAKKGRKVMFEYLLIDGENDADEHARELATLMKKKLYMVNLIPYNPTGSFRPSSQERVQAFRDILEKAGVEVTIRHRFGDDIKGACGQLATKKKAR